MSIPVYVQKPNHPDKAVKVGYADLDITWKSAALQVGLDPDTVIDGSMRTLRGVKQWRLVSLIDVEKPGQDIRPPGELLPAVISDKSSSGHSRLTHVPTGTTCLLEPWMNGLEWLARVEVFLSRIPGLPFIAYSETEDDFHRLPGDNRTTDTLLATVRRIVDSGIAGLYDETRVAAARDRFKDEFSASRFSSAN